MGGKLRPPLHALIYALGGGYGHVVRAALLARALTERGIGTAVLAQTGTTDVAHALGACTIEVERTDSTRNLRRCIDQLLELTSVHHFIVDALPSGLLGELRPLPMHVRTIALLRLHRSAGEQVFEKSLRRYDDIYDLEPHFRWMPDLHGHSTHSLGPMARRLETDDIPPHWRRAAVVLVPADARQARMLLRLGARLLRRGIHALIAYRGFTGLLTEQPRPWFPLRLDPRFQRVVVGAAGFNLTYECLRAGMWHIAVPRGRRFDDQLRRGKGVAEVARSPEDLEHRVNALLAHEARRPSLVVRDPEDVAAIMLERALSPEPRGPLRVVGSRG